MTQAVLPWPSTHALSTSGVVVISIRTPSGDDRTSARQSIRQALREALGVLLAKPVVLVDLPAQGLRVGGTDIGISVSHASGLSVAAIHLPGAVGIDVMRVDDGEPCLSGWDAVARDYLGPEATRRIASVPDDRRALCFAQEWTQREAQLKLLGVGLTEWDAVQETQCTTMRLCLPAGFVGAVSVPRN